MAGMNDMMALVDTYTADSTSVGAFATVFAQTLAVQQAFIKKMFAEQATIDELQSKALLFSNYVGSITSQNPSIGDMMIYMGKNPRLTAASREFQFAISQYLGKSGGREMWDNKLITRILFTGAMLLYLNGCVQTSEEVYSHAGEAFYESDYHEVALEQDDGGALSALSTTQFGEWYYIFSFVGKIYRTKNYKNFEFVKYWDILYYNEIIGSKSYKGKFYILFEDELYQTDYDFSSFTKIKEGTYFRQLIYWNSEDALVLIDSVNASTPDIIWMTKDGVNWTSHTGSSEVLTDYFVTNDYIVTGINRGTIEYWDSEFNKNTKTNPLGVDSSYSVRNYDGEQWILFKNTAGFAVLGTDLESYNVIAQTKTMNTPAFVGKYAYYSAYQEGASYFYKCNLITGEETEIPDVICSNAVSNNGNNMIYWKQGRILYMFNPSTEKAFRMNLSPDILNPTDGSAVTIRGIYCFYVESLATYVLTVYDYSGLHVFYSKGC